MGLVGFGLAGTHHIDGVRRLGYVDVVAVASSNPDAVREKAARYGIPKVYGSFEALAADPDVQVVHNTTPNHLHAPVIRAALKHGKHIVSDKPLAVSSAEALELLKAAEAAGVVHAVTFNYRGNPLIQEARSRIAHGELGALHFIHGAYLQDWLLEETDYSWRLDPEKGGPSCALADIGSHWCDLAEHISGARIASVLADLSTVVKVRQRPVEAMQTFLRDDAMKREPVEVTSEDLASVLVRFENGVKGCFSVGQVCAGHKNDLWIEINGRQSSVRWERDRHEELWIGHRNRANEHLAKDPWLLGPEARKFARLPGGHPEGYSDDFCNILEEIYLRISGAAPLDRASAAATFADGYRINCIVDALLTSHAAGGAWTKVASSAP
jgi:predicted dehydrogenase